MSKSIVTLDAIGRIQLPLELCKQLGLNIKDAIKFNVKNDKIFLNKTILKKNSLVSNIDEFQRIVLPLEMRKLLQFKENDKLQLEILKNKLVLSKIV